MKHSVRVVICPECGEYDERQGAFLFPEGTQVLNFYCDLHDGTVLRPEPRDQQIDQKKIRRDQTPFWFEGMCAEPDCKRRVKIYSVALDGERPESLMKGRLFAKAFRAECSEGHVTKVTLLDEPPRVLIMPGAKRRSRKRKKV